MKHRGGILSIAILGLMGALAAPPAMPQARTANKNTAPSGSQQRGTGVVPPGVKLAPEMPPAAPAKAFHFPPAVTKTLENGLRVFVVSDHRQPAIAVRLVLTSAGTVHDPAGLPGVAAMTANLLTQGTEKRSAQQIAEAIDFVGGSLNARADKDDTTVTLNAVKKDLDLGLDLMSDVVLHPVFRQEELERRRQQLLSALRVNYADPGFLASAVFRRAVYGPSPYGLPDSGTPETVPKLDRDALVKFHDATFAPNSSLLAFAGDVTPPEAFAAAEKYFGAWPKKEVPPAELPPPAQATGLHLIVVDKPDAVQTQIRVGRIGIPRSSPDYIPLLVTNRIFGGGFNSRLNTEVRIRKGLTYGANSSFIAQRFAGDFLAGTFTRTEATAEATQLVVNLIGKMATGEVTPAELNFARDYLVGVYPIQSETAEQVADRVLTVAEYGLPADYNETYPAKIRSVTAPEVKVMGERYFDAGDLDIVLVGNAAQFRDALKKAFPQATWEEIPLDQLDLLRSDFRRPKEETPAATPESLERGAALLKAAAQAAGGDLIRQVSSLEISTSGKIFAPGQEFSIASTVTILYPDRFHVSLKLPFGQIQQGYDGKAGWIQGPQGVMDAPPALVGEFHRGIVLTGGWGLFRESLEGKIQAQFLGEAVVGGRKLEAVLWNAPFGPIKLYFDPATRLLAAAHFRSLTAQGPAEIDEQWSDFRAVEGRRYPFHTTVLRDGAKFTESSVEDLKVNPKTDASLFAKPQPPSPPPPPKQP